MNDLVLYDLRRRFSRARELCPNMSEEVYALADYFAAVTNDTLNPDGVAVTLLCIRDDLARQRCGFGREVKFPEYFAEETEQIAVQMPYFLQIVDVVAAETNNEEFANEVRNICQRDFGWVVPKYIALPDAHNCQPNIKAAANWWVDIIQHPTTGNVIAATFGTPCRQYTREDLDTFRNALIDGIEHQKTHGYDPSRIVLFVDYAPEGVLDFAAMTANVSRLSFPSKTAMVITDDEVRVQVGQNAPYQVIWKANSEI